MRVGLRGFVGQGVSAGKVKGMTETRVVRVHEQRTVHIDVMQAEPRRRPFARGEYLPQTLVLVFRRTNDSRWTCSAPELYGPVLWEDGSASDTLTMNETLLEMPGWVVEAIEQARPDAATASSPA
jgi:hypothetical protein